MSRSTDLIVAMDNDDAGLKASNHLLKLTRDGFLECKFFDYSNSSAKDVGDMPDSDILRGLNNAKHCILGSKALR